MHHTLSESKVTSPSLAAPPRQLCLAPAARLSTSLSIFSLTTWHLWSPSLPSLAVSLPSALKSQSVS